MPLPDSGVPIQVYELTEGWSFSVGTEGTQGTRVYLESTLMDPSLTTVDLPQIGDSFDSTYTSCKLKSIQVTLVNNSSSCGKKYTCNYDGKPYSEQVQLGEADLPKSVDIGGELLSFVIKSPGCKWNSDGKQVEQPIYKRETLVVYRMSRKISDFDDFMDAVKANVNKINDDTFFDCKKHMLLFNGATLQEYFDNYGVKRWKADLQWTYRSVTGDSTAGKDGWRYVLREDTGTFDTITIPGFELYAEGDFEGLLTSSTTFGTSINQSFPSQ